VETKVAQTVDGFLESFAGGDAAPLKGVEELGIFGGDLAEGEIRVDSAGVFVEIEEELGFGADEATEGPLAIDDVVDEAALFGTGGVKAGVVFGDKQLVRGKILGREDGGMERGHGVGDMVLGAVFLPPVGVVFEFIHSSLPGAIGAQQGGEIRRQKSQMIEGKGNINVKLR
jgi:hypothetical protein